MPELENDPKLIENILKLAHIRMDSGRIMQST